MNSGQKIPVIGFGTCLVEGGARFFAEAILKHGYRHLDTAMKYGNEPDVGEALQICFKQGIKRKDVFITTKLDQDEKWDVEAACRASLKRLQLDYIDLYLIHWMKPKIDWDSKDWNVLSPSNQAVW